LLRALAFDRNLKGRVHDPLTVAVVANPNGSVSSERQVELRNAFHALASMHIAGFRVAVIDLSYRSEAALVEDLEKNQVAAIFAGEDMDPFVETLARIGREHHVTTLSERRDHVERGFTLGVTVYVGRPKLIVNLTSSRAQGMDLSSE